MARTFLIVAALSGLLATLMGAVGAHLLRGRLDEHLTTVLHTANQYHFYHSLALALIAGLALRYPTDAWLRWAGYAMIAGLILFCGSLYWLACGGEPLYAKLAPTGGIALMVGWLLLAVFAVKSI